MKLLRALGLVLALLVPASAAANGNESHLWVSLWARDALPEGELRSLLELRDLALQNGSNFPDGGYAVEDGYGEIAHWEPFQSAYLDWIVEHYAPPWSDEAQEHIAFLMGMASHGMSDQTYDCAYLPRSDVYDAGSPGTSIGRDGATDVALVGAVGCAEPPESWLPEQTMAELMLSQAGHEVDADTIHDGNVLVLWSMGVICGAADDEDLLAEYVAAYPWAGEHQVDPDQPGNPPNTASVVAAYWEELWARLHGEGPLAEPMIGQYPPSGPSGWPAGTDAIDAMVSFVVARGLDAGTVSLDSVSVVDEDGLAISFDIHHCYGSHVYGLRPVDGWSEDSEHTVTVGPGLVTWDGLDVAPFGFTFDTSPPPVDTGETEEPEDCGCSGVGGLRGGLACLGLATLGFVTRRRSRWSERGVSACPVGCERRGTKQG